MRGMKLKKSKEKIHNNNKKKKKKEEEDGDTIKFMDKNYESKALISR